MSANAAYSMGATLSIRIATTKGFRDRQGTIC